MAKKRKLSVEKQPVEEKGADQKQSIQNKEKTLVVSSRGITFRYVEVSSCC